jgi:hypothetical protein
LVELERQGSTSANTHKYCAARRNQTPTECLAWLAQRWLNPTGTADVSEICRDIVQVSGNWNEFLEHLAYHDLECVPAGSGLALYRISTNMRLCAACEVGLSYRSLMKRFGAPIPGEDRLSIIDRWRVEKAHARTKARS